ncbi:MAG: hypothetical protein HC838_16895 [Spirulinaceae cyanobacterium RM2_2_10]|nr:hypothetical protein [Spirulinaceae cyanobacterium SM2_1_0]NJO21372.1 hypothetical protein [Spirulinaceae cyanobacterium RM2_2_10]
MQSGQLQRQSWDTPNPTLLPAQKFWVVAIALSASSPHPPITEAEPQR